MPQGLKWPDMAQSCRALGSMGEPSPKPWRRRILRPADVSPSSALYPSAPPWFASVGHFLVPGQDHVPPRPTGEFVRWATVRY